MRPPETGWRCAGAGLRSGAARLDLRSGFRLLKTSGPLAIGVFLLFEFMAAEDVEIEDEDAHILRGVTRMERRMTAGGVVEHRGCGFRAASVHQYREDLQAAGFDVVSCHEAWSRALPFGMVLAQVAPTSTSVPLAAAAGGAPRTADPSRP